MIAFRSDPPIIPSFQQVGGSVTDARFKNTSQGVALAQILPVVSLFSGSGSLDEGFVQAGLIPCH